MRSNLYQKSPLQVTLPVQSLSRSAAAVADSAVVGRRLQLTPAASTLDGSAAVHETGGAVQLPPVQVRLRRLEVLLPGSSPFPSSPAWIQSPAPFSLGTGYHVYHVLGLPVLFASEMW